VTVVRRVLRYDFRERIVHTGAALSYTYLLLTGLAFWTPWLYWIAIVLGGGYVSRLLHPWVGLLFAAVVFVMYAQWRRDMRTTPEDRVWRRAMAHYVRNEDTLVPPAGRFNYGQKSLFWVMVLGGLVLLL
jgi:formate dehydrogenase subunit gamma